LQQIPASTGANRRQSTWTFGEEMLGRGRQSAEKIRDGAVEGGRQVQVKNAETARNLRDDVLPS
jgi:hypothetical protein